MSQVALADYGEREYGAGLSVIFMKGEKYPQSTWIWHRYGDTEIVMTIWGPDESGKLYFVEIARLSAEPFEIRIGGKTILTIEEIKELSTSRPEIGYYVIEVAL